MESHFNPKFAIGTTVKFKERVECPRLIVVDYYGYTSNGRIMVTIKRTDVKNGYETSVPEDDLELD